MKKVLFSNAAILLLIAAVYAADDVAALGCYDKAVSHEIVPNR